MKELLQSALETRGKIQRYETQHRKLPKVEDMTIDLRAGCFAAVGNNLVMALELLSYYQSVWQKPTTGYSESEIYRSREENGQRVIITLRHLFISSMSSIEYYMKLNILK